MTKKIDLSEFDAITKGEWRIIRNTNAVGGIDIGAVDPMMPDAGYRPVVQFTAQYGDQVMQIERDVADMKAIAAVPKMIAELKRCYERIDELEKEPSVTIDEWDIPSQGPCVTVRYNGREYVGTLEEWDTSEEE